MSRQAPRPKARKGLGARKSERQAGKREAWEQLRAPVDQRVEARYAALLAEPGADLAWVRALVAAARSLP